MKKLVLLFVFIIAFYASSTAQVSPNNSSKQVIAFTSNSAETDTLQALNNLFRRKRKGGIWRSSVFGGLTAIMTVGLINYKPSTITINQGGSSQTMQLDSGPAAFNYVLLGFSGIMTVTGFTQYAKYNGDQQQKAISDYKAGKLSPEIILKFKKKDFKAN